MTHENIAMNLAEALLAGPASEEGFAQRLAQALGRKHRWLRPFARRAFQRFGPDLAYDQRQDLIQFICDDAGYKRAWAGADKPRIRRYFFAAPAMHQRSGALAGIILPDIPTPGDLAVWLGITASQLEWYADLRGMIRSSEGALCHYRYKWIPKRQGDYRLIESPKAVLCAIQRKILHDILDHVPAHQAAHGFRRGHSCLTYAAPHVGKQVVMRMDLQNFFGSISAARVNATFRTLGYPEETARYLTGLCTTRISSREILKIPGAGRDFTPSWQQRRELASPHLPQGAPTSPALANLCALHLDFRLAALANKMDARYTRYADDLAFSGDEATRRSARRLSELVAVAALAEGFEVNHRKTRIMHKSDRQVLTGIVVNEKLNVHRSEFENLKAILHNCLRSGADSQNRDKHGDFRAHLSGRISHLKRLNPARGARLQVMLEQIDWQQP